MDREPEQSIRLPQPTERKTASGYHGPARVENAFFRYASILGDGLRACSPAGRGTEVVLVRNILNQMYSARRTFIKAEFKVMITGSDFLTNDEFWKSANNDGARIYSGKANWPNLAKRILKDIEEEIAA